MRISKQANEYMKDMNTVYGRSYILNYRERCEFTIDHRSYTHNLSSCEIKGWKNSGLNRIQTHELCDTGAVLYQLSYQAVWELFTLLVCNILIEGVYNCNDQS